MAEEEAQVPEENAAGGDAAAGAEAAAEGAAEESPKKKSGVMLPLILMPILCAGAAYGVGFMLLKKVDKVLAGIQSGAVLTADAGAAADGDAAHGDAAHGDDHGEAARRCCNARAGPCSPSTPSTPGTPGTPGTPPLGSALCLHTASYTTTSTQH